MPARRLGAAADDGLAEARRAAIMDSAERLVAVRGFDALRLRDVAQDAGVSIGLIQHYFDTRDDLLLQTMREASRRRVSQWQALASSATTPSSRLVSLLVGAIDDPHRCAVWLETCAAASRHNELRIEVQTTQDSWRDVLATAVDDGQRGGDLRCTVSPADAVDVLVSLIDGLMLSTAAEGDDDERRGHRTRILLETAERLLDPTTPFTPRDVA